MTRTERIQAERRLAVHEVGHLLATEGKLEAARRIFDGWIAIEPDDAYAHLALGWIHRRSGRRGEARAALRRVLERTADASPRDGTEADLAWRAAIALAEIELASGSPQAAARVLGDRIRWSGGEIPERIGPRVSALLSLADR